MRHHAVVSRDEWLTARRNHLAKEKELTRMRDKLSQERRELPWVEVDEDYVFDGPDGKQTLAEFFDGRGQLIVYHFMFHPSWDEGCKSCSFFADGFDPLVVHLNHRDVTIVAVSRAPLEQLQAYQERMGWSFKWVSSGDSSFNRDYHVSFTPEEMEKGEMFYNFQTTSFPSEEGPGLSVFRRTDDGKVYHTYSCYARGLDSLLGAYALLDLVPKGRDEADLPYGMAWLRHHDRYED